MDMGWLETIRFIGLDLQLAAIASLVALDLIERAVQAAWLAAHRDYQALPVAPVRKAPRLTIGGAHHA